MELLIIINAFCLAYLIVCAIFFMCENKKATLIISIFIIPLPFLYFLIGGLFGVGTMYGNFFLPENSWLFVFLAPTYISVLFFIRAIMRASKNANQDNH